MRTTVTLDPDVDALLHREMSERGLSFKQAINEALRRGLTGPQTRKPFRSPTYHMGEPRVSLHKANQLAAELDNEEIIRKMELGK